MARAYLPPRNSPFAPCPTPCKHRDCLATRELLAKTCRGCRDGFDFGQA